MMKKTLPFLILVALLFTALDRHFHKEQHRFAPSKVLSFMPYNLEWEIPGVQEEQKALARKILEQPFSYFDKGSQAYVFVSRDGNYVLKLFKQHRLRPHSWFTQLQDRLFTAVHYRYKYKRKKFRESLMSCKNAFTGFREETGLLYLHLNRAPDLEVEVLCADERGVLQRLCIDDTVFMLQRRAEMVYPAIERAMREGGAEEGKAILSSLIGLLRHLDARGVYGNDPVLKKNFGVIEGKAIQIDVGRFRVDPNKTFRENIPRISADLKEWIDSHYPALSSHIEAELSASA